MTDLLAVLRPTQSSVLWAQILGRAMRTAPGKAESRLLDFGGNVLRHGPDDIQPVRQGEPQEAKNLRVCPKCDSVNRASAKVCDYCGFEWVPKPRAIRIDPVESSAVALACDGAEQTAAKSTCPRSAHTFTARRAHHRVYGSFTALPTVRWSDGAMSLTSSPSSTLPAASSPGSGGCLFQVGLTSRPRGRPRKPCVASRVRSRCPNP
jgi:hypothetical protein